jgi:hypothetical protein
MGAKKITKHRVTVKSSECIVPDFAIRELEWANDRYYCLAHNLSTLFQSIESHQFFARRFDVEETILKAVEKSKKPLKPSDINDMVGDPSALRHLIDNGLLETTVDLKLRRSKVPHERRSESEHPTVDNVLSILEEMFQRGTSEDVCGHNCKNMYFCEKKKGHKGDHTDGGLAWKSEWGHNSRVDSYKPHCKKR